MGTKQNLDTIREDITVLEGFHDWCQDQLEQLETDSIAGDTESELRHNTYEKLLARIKNNSSSLKGVVHGYLREVQSAIKHLQKGRVVIIQKHADVTVGDEGDVFAKSVQIKSTYTTTVGDVDTHLANAAYQISGVNEKPRPRDRRIIDVTIANFFNTWPFTPKKTWDGTLETLLSACEARILRYVNENKPHSERGLTTEAKSWLHDVADFKNELGNKIWTNQSKNRPGGSRNTRMVLESAPESSKKAVDGQYVFDYITVKIRFYPGRKVSLEGKTKDSLKVAIFAVFKVKDKLYCEYLGYELEAGGKETYRLKTMELE
jgi:hypothetical protein